MAHWRRSRIAGPDCALAALVTVLVGLFALWALAWALLPATARGEEACLQWPVAITSAQINNPDASLVKTFDGAIAAQFIQVLNQLPPACSSLAE